MTTAQEVTFIPQTLQTQMKQVGATSAFEMMERHTRLNTEMAGITLGGTQIETMTEVMTPFTLTIKPVC
jgi:hypothetical protein